jgi:hypothetical protein
MFNLLLLSWFSTSQQPSYRVHARYLSYLGRKRSSFDPEYQQRRFTLHWVLVLLDCEVTFVLCDLVFSLSIISLGHSNSQMLHIVQVCVDASTLHDFDITTAAGSHLHAPTGDQRQVYAPQGKKSLLCNQRLGPKGLVMRIWARPREGVML